jgi:dinuclear metal center YbgI/SA1388 family protein
MHVCAFIDEMERVAPCAIADETDAGKIGLVVEGKPEIGQVCCALDATLPVVNQAISASADMLVVHHTPLWTPVTSMTGRTASLMRAILSAELNLYVMHTNFDRAPGGVNDALADILSLTGPEPMSLGLVGGCTLSVNEIAGRIGSSVRVWGRIGQLRRLAVVGGSGFDPDLLFEAQGMGADAFLSAELKHSVARVAPLPCIEATHYALEAPGMQRLSARMGWQYIDDKPVISTIQ